MKFKRKILGIIPARSGSKGIKNKNIIRINGKHLIYFTIKRALESKLISDVIVSTDSLKIKKISERYGAKVPFLRPKYLSSDRSNIIDTIIYCIKKCENDFNYDYIVLLQPTSPLREKNEIDQAIAKLIKLNFDSLIALTKLDEPHPIKLKKIKHHKVTPYIKNNLNDNPPRQSLDTVFKPSGNIYIFKRNLIMKNKKILGKKTTFINIKKSRFLNIDDKDDLFSAKRLLKRFK